MLLFQWSKQSLEKKKDLQARAWNEQNAPFSRHVFTYCCRSVMWLVLMFLHYQNILRRQCHCFLKKLWKFSIISEGTATLSFQKISSLSIGLTTWTSLDDAKHCLAVSSKSKVISTLSKHKLQRYSGLPRLTGFLLPLQEW